TGKTQGMRLRMMPPARAISSASPSEGALSTAGAAPGTAANVKACVTVRLSSRSLITSTPSSVFSAPALRPASSATVGTCRFCRRHERAGLGREELDRLDARRIERRAGKPQRQRLPGKRELGAPRTWLRQRRARLLEYVGPAAFDRRLAAGRLHRQGELELPV